jgi:hypothetical protein
MELWNKNTPVRKEPKRFRPGRYKRRIQSENTVVRIRKPTILRVDVRRMYAEMLAIVKNSDNVQLMMGFLDTYFHPNVESIGISYSSTTNQFKQVTRSGFQSIAKYWYNEYMLSPDVVVKLSETKMFLDSTERSKVVTNLLYTSTRLFQTSSDDEAQLILNEDSNIRYDSSSHPETSQDSINSSVTAFVQSSNKVHETLRVNPDPQAINIRGSVTLHMDENKYIYRVEFTPLETIATSVSLNSQLLGVVR